MTTATSSFAWASGSGAAAKVWIQGVHDLVIAAGLTQTTDTGQLDPTATPGTSGASVSFGYLVYKFPDTLQATAPIFLKLTFTTEGSSRSQVAAQVSASTNGAGTLGSPSHTSGITTMSAFQSPLTSYACYADGTFSMVLGYGYTSGGTANNSVSALVIDRARDATGTALAVGFLVESPVNPGGSYGMSRSLYGAASPASGGMIPSMVPSGTATGSSDGANVNVFRHYMMVPGVKPSLGCLTYFNAEFGALTPFTATVLGSSHTWLPVGAAMNYWSVNNTNIAHCAAIRWE